MPIRLLIGPGLILVGVGLLLMRGLNAQSGWTHLIPGMIVGGLGIGLVNPPLASTAVGVVPPEQAGMASGINSTFRQVGIATGIALLGTLFSNKVADEVRTAIAAVPGLSHQGPRIATAVQSGEIGNVIAKLPASAAAEGGRDHESRLHHRPEPHPAGRGDHRAGSGRGVAGGHPDQGLRPAALTSHAYPASPQVTLIVDASDNPRSRSAISLVITRDIRPEREFRLGNANESRIPRRYERHANPPAGLLRIASVSVVNLFP